MQLKEMLHWPELAGQPMIVQDITLTPLSQALIVRLPWSVGIWHRPTAVLMQQGERVRRMPIVDLTRLLQLGLLGFSVVMTIVYVVTFVRRKEDGP